MFLSNYKYLQDATKKSERLNQLKCIVLKNYSPDITGYG